MSAAPSGRRISDGARGPRLPRRDVARQAPRENHARPLTWAMRAGLVWYALTPAERPTSGLLVPGEATRVSLYERSFLDSFAVDAKLTTDGREEASNWMTLAAHPSEDAGAAFAGGAP